jgi:hypothetical protein
MRWVLAVATIVALAAVPAYAITVDGDMSDWTAAGLVQTTIVTEGTGTFQITGWGATIQGDTVYAFVQTQNAMGVPGGTPTDNSYPGLWIDIDNSVATTLGGLPGAVPAGVDINAEIDFDNGAIPTGGGPAGHAVNFWGHGNDWANGSAASTGVDAHNAGQTIFEWSVPLSEVVAEAALCSGAASGPVWKVYVGGEGGPTWGREAGGPLLISSVPEPGTIAMLIGAGLALLGYALRRR